MVSYPIWTAFVRRLRLEEPRVSNTQIELAERCIAALARLSEGRIGCPTQSLPDSDGNLHLSWCGAQHELDFTIGSDADVVEWTWTDFQCGTIIGGECVVSVPDTVFLRDIGECVQGDRVRALYDRAEEEGPAGVCTGR